MITKRQPAEPPSAHHRPNPLGGVVGHHIARRDADALNEDVRRHDSGERDTRTPAPATSRQAGSG